MILTEEWSLALDLFVESLHKPDNELRNAAREQGCYEELMEIRRMLLEFTEDLRET